MKRARRRFGEAHRELLLVLGLQLRMGPAVGPQALGTDDVEEELQSERDEPGLHVALLRHGRRDPARDQAPLGVAVVVVVVVVGGHEGGQKVRMVRAE